MTLICRETIQRCDCSHQSNMHSLDSKLYICDNCFPVHVKINLIYSKITKVICVMNRVVQGDTDFNCFFFFFFHPIVPLYLTHTAGCHVALWVMHPPRAPRSSKWAVAGPRGNLVGCSFLCFPLVVLTYFWGHWQRLWRIVKSCKNIISLFCLWKDLAWYLSCKCVVFAQIDAFSHLVQILNFSQNKWLFYKSMNRRWRIDTCNLDSRLMYMLTTHRWYSMAKATGDHSGAPLI